VRSLCLRSVRLSCRTSDAVKNLSSRTFYQALTLLSAEKRKLI